MGSHGTRQWTADLARLTAERDALRDAAAVLLDVLAADEQCPACERWANPGGRNHEDGCTLVALRGLVADGHDCDDDTLCGCGDRLSARLGARCGNCQAADEHRTLWEGETRMVMHYDPRENGKDSFIPLPLDGFDVPPGTRVRVQVVARDAQEPRPLT